MEKERLLIPFNTPPHIGRESPFRLLGSWTAVKMSQWLCSVPKDLYLSSYFCCKRFVIREVIRYDNAYPYLAGLLLRVTKKVANVDVPHHERMLGRSGYSLHKLVSLWLNGFTAFSVKPLRIATVMGGLTAAAGFMYTPYIIARKLLNPAAPIGYSSMMCVLLFTGVMIMLMLGLIYICLNKAPQYVVRDTVNAGEESALKMKIPAVLG